MKNVEPSYLTCTASQAQEFNIAHPHGFQSLNQLLEARAESHPDVCVAGFPELKLVSSEWELLTLTYSSLLAAATAVAAHYTTESSLYPRQEGDKSDKIIALLSPSCADFLVTLFAALRLGYGVLLLAPQNTNEAIKHLCQATSATHLVCHSSLLTQGRSAVQTSPWITVVNMAHRSVWKDRTGHTPSIPVALPPNEEAELTTLVMHTSGSTGMPKPIYHPHRIWTQAIPCMPGKPAFTTTPLFHGGSADLLRSLNALSTLYLFPSLYPVTTSNVLDALSACPDASAFLSVPYILKMLAEDEKGRGMEMLRGLDLVSVGGAPLPTQLGNMMVQRGIKLVSRYGSSECGFLMSSHRNYATDLDWEWLHSNGQDLQFEAIDSRSDDDESFELVVGKNWPTRVVSNRDDGSFATGDLYAKHPTIRNAWKYCGRVDDIIVMMNGKKVSANAIETKLRASPDVAEAVVFGASRALLGVLVLPASPSPSNTIPHHIREVNASIPSHAAIIEEMVVILPHNAWLPRTSKGSVIRPQALKLYNAVIDDAYRRFDDGIGVGEAESSVAGVCEEDFSTGEGIRQFMRNLVREACGKGVAISDDEDLFNFGITSLQALRIRGALQRVLAPKGKALGSNVVFEYPTIQKLSQHVVSLGSGDIGSFDVETRAAHESAQHQLMRDFVSQFGTFTPAVSISGVVILTGATGALGAHLLAEILLRTTLQVVTLVRAKDNKEALHRVLSNLDLRKITVDNPTRSRIEALAVEIAENRLGLAKDTWDDLLARTELVVHAAWPVNFALGLESFAPILKGTRTLLDLAISSRRHATLIFCSSISASAQLFSPSRSHSIPPVHESLPHVTSDAQPMGYARSKWVAEHMCNEAHRSGALAGRVLIARIGQLCGDIQHGIWSETEAWPLLIASARYTGCLPLLDQQLHWLPFDAAAKAIIDLAMVKTRMSSSAEDVSIYHVVNPHGTPWTTVLEYLADSGLVFERVSIAQWYERVEGMEDETKRNSLMLSWPKAKNPPENPTVHLVYDTTRAKQASQSLRETPPISKSLVRKFVMRWVQTGFILQ